MKYIYPIIGVAIIILSFYLVITKKQDEKIIDPAPISTTQNLPPNFTTANLYEDGNLPPNIPEEKTTPNTVLITDEGFMPDSLEITLGTKVNFINSTNHTVWVASSPHPIHTDLPGFDNKGGTPAGGTYEYTFEKIGTWKYHDHLNPTLYGKVIVK